MQSHALIPAPSGTVALDPSVLKRLMWLSKASTALDIEARPVGKPQQTTIPLSSFHIKSVGRRTRHTSRTISLVRAEHELSLLSATIAISIMGPQRAPLPVTTDRMVLKIIFKSIQTEWLRKYHTSSFTLSSYFSVSLLLPHCHSPVMPGLMEQ